MPKILTAAEEEIALRQLELAKYIGAEFRNCDKLIPLDRHSSFAVSPPSHNWYAQPSWTITWFAVGKQLQIHARHSSVIDHAWLAGFNAEPPEPWALVTEPSMDADKAQTIAQEAAEAMGDWGIDIHVLPPARSAWKPGACLPIVAVLRDGWLNEFVFQAADWAFDWTLPSEGRFH